MKVQDKLSKGITGIAGEYFVAGELSRRGFMASITLRNNEGIDIHASNNSGDRIYTIQVKTNQHGGRSWPLSSKVELIKSENLFYIFVLLKGLKERPEYFIVPSITIAERIKEVHSAWLATSGKKGQPHHDNNLRRFDDKEGEFLEKWDLLE
jgi:hypothetical protein